MTAGWALEKALPRLRIRDDIQASALYRLSRSPEDEIWWGRTARYRFDDPLRRFGVTYTAPDVIVAFSETLLHERASFVDGAWQLRQADLEARGLVRFESSRRLRLVDLSGAAAKAMGLNNDISASDDYAVTQALSRTIHEAVPEADGLYAISRQLNTHGVVVLFQRSGCTAARFWTPLMDDPGLGALLEFFAIELLA